jgi:outer membrane protein TolC
MKLKTIYAILALGISELASVEIAKAKSLDVGGIKQRLPAPTTPVKLAISSHKLLAQNTNNSNPKLPNELILPNTSGQVQITGKQSISVQQALDIAFRNNRQVQAARLTIDRSQTGIREAQAAQALQVGLTGSLQNQGSALIVGTQSPLGNSTGTDVRGQLQATYNVFSAGRNQSSVRAAEEQVRSDKLDLLRVEQLIRSQVLTAYYDLQAADSAVIINQAAVTDATRSLSDAQLQQRAGIGTKFDVLRTQVQLATANQDLTNSQGQQQTARKKIAQILVIVSN